MCSRLARAAHGGRHVELYAQRDAAAALVVVGHVENVLLVRVVRPEMVDAVPENQVHGCAGPGPPPLPREAFEQDTKGARAVVAARHDVVSIDGDDGWRRALAGPARRRAHRAVAGAGCSPRRQRQHAEST